jgi:effector-associated domain 2 (EAD2)-containing protein
MEHLMPKQDASPGPDRISAALTVVVVDVLLTIPEFVAPAGRQLILAELGELEAAIPRHASARLDAFSVVSTCRRYPDGLLRLVEAVRHTVGDVPEVYDLARAVAGATQPDPTARPGDASPTQ